MIAEKRDSYGTIIINCFYYMGKIISSKLIDIHFYGGMALIMYYSDGSIIYSKVFKTGLLTNRKLKRMCEHLKCR